MAAVRKARQDHKRAGNPVAEWRDGKVVWIAPEHFASNTVTQSMQVTICCNVMIGPVQDGAPAGMDVGTRQRKTDLARIEVVGLRWVGFLRRLASISRR